LLKIIPAVPGYVGDNRALADGIVLQGLDQLPRNCVDADLNVERNSAWDIVFKLELGIVGEGVGVIQHPFQSGFFIRSNNKIGESFPGVVGYIPSPHPEAVRTGFQAKQGVNDLAGAVVIQGGFEEIIEYKGVLIVCV
jgi:hypothetical protein